MLQVEPKWTGSWGEFQNRIQLEFIPEPRITLKNKTVHTECNYQTVLWYWILELRNNLIAFWSHLILTKTLCDSYYFNPILKMRKRRLMEVFCSRLHSCDSKPVNVLVTTGSMKCWGGEGRAALGTKEPVSYFILGTESPVTWANFHSLIIHTVHSSFFLFSLFAFLFPLFLLFFLFKCTFHMSCFSIHEALSHMR